VFSGMYLVLFIEFLSFAQRGIIDDSRLVVATFYDDACVLNDCIT
jgi:hypothetical protein